MKRSAFWLIAVFFLLPSVVRAWGPDGHQLTALIAEDRLTPAAKAAIHSILGDDVAISDGEVADWPDHIRRDRPETGPWHYVDMPIDATSFDEKRDGANGNNVIDKLAFFEARLKDSTTKKNDRIEALKFVVHFVGDLHQPLHCIDRHGDKGGNARLVFLLTRPYAVNLHSVWDSQILLIHKGDTRNAAYADALNAKITPAEAAEWSKGTPTDWAMESHNIAVEHVYKDVPENGPPPKLDKKYVDAAGLVIDKQLQRGGFRLAMILNDIFK